MPEYTVVPGPGDRQPLTTKHPRREVQQGPRREIQRPGARLNPHPRFRRLQTAEKNPPTGGIRRRADTAYSTQRWLGDGRPGHGAGDRYDRPSTFRAARPRET